MDELKYLNIKEVDKVEIPAGLEERLSAQIDQWAKSEKKSTRRFSTYKILAMAACLSAVIGIGGILSVSLNRNKAHIDTFDDPQFAQAEAEKALYLLAYNLDKGITNLKKVQRITTNTSNTIKNSPNQEK